MPKKTAAARSGAQYQRARGQKSFELVRPEGAENESALVEAQAEPEQVRPVPAAVVPTKKGKSSAEKKLEVSATTAAVVKEEPVVASSATATVGPQSASARIAARRQASQKTSQRQGAALITAEHFSYVRRDLITIAILATIMVAAIVILYFVLI
ncbi:hypothetical protein [Dictyobacter arantiisoli]|uniref:Uncharacterized protein n=1 Tax=Dictyobacter arantiisoli TaxID=2014874 RepID=A0A5A5TA69_9CHLR|nr:hypothetical protein [Dictyobacter arantiisoli]GCF07913.1 hypothetical protein KDI_14770 [Dictyobacter arantiisoli]